MIFKEIGRVMDRFSEEALRRTRVNVDFGVVFNGGHIVTSLYDTYLWKGLHELVLERIFAAVKVRCCRGELTAENLGDYLDGL